MSKMASQAYQRASINTSDPTKIIVMLYDGAIRNLRQAIEHFDAGRRVEASERILRTQDIIHYLHNSLDFEKGGEISINLSKLYDYVRDTLALANIEGSTESIETCILVLQPLLEGWRGVVELNASQNKSAAGAGGADRPAGVSMVG